MLPPDALVGRYEALADALIHGDSTVVRGTMMGFPCLRRHGRFFASVEQGSGRLILKLPSERVRELVTEGIGSPFAPNGKIFREWVSLDETSDWTQLAEEASAFAAND